MKTHLLLILIFSPLLLKAQEADTITFNRSLPIDEVVVTGSKTLIDPRLLSTTVSIVGQNAIESANRSSLLPTLTEQIPGLFITSRGVMGYGVSSGAAGGMSMRGVGGSPTTGVMVLIDGHPQYMGLMGHPIADAYQSSLAERIEVARGPASVLYGSNAMGGVINIITRQTTSEGSHTDARIGYGSYNTLQTNLTNRTRRGRVTATITGEYDRSDGHRADMGFEQYGGSARVGIVLSQHWDMAANIALTHFNASNPGAISAPIIDNDSRITRGITALSLRNHNAQRQGAISMFYNWGRHKINDGYSAETTPPDYLFVSRDKMAGVSWYQNFAIMTNGNLTVGIDYQFMGGEAENDYYDSRNNQNIVDKNLHNIAAYTTLRQGIRHWLMVDAGIRYERNSHAGDAWIPQGGISVLLPRNTQIKAIISKGFRFPTIREMYMFPPQNPDLQPEHIINYELSFRQRQGRVDYGVNLYYIDGKNIIQTRMVDGRPRNINTGKIINHGLEADINWAINSRWQLSANYSYLRMKYPVVAAPKHKLFMAIRYAHKRWTMNSSIQHINGLVTQLSPLTSESYTLWNANLEYRAAEYIKLYIHAENLLSERYEINAGYPMPRTTINAGVKLSF